jgi:selenide,water dikinase
VRISDEVAPEMAEIFFDPQTSGGLLITLPEPQALPLLAELQAAGNLEAAVVGRVVEQTSFAIDLV